MPETKDLILKHPDIADYRDMFRNIWSRPESARYMLWNISLTEEEAMSRMERTIAFQRGKPLWTVYEKKSGMAIGFAGIEQISDTICAEYGIAIGPDFTGQGYGKQILRCLMDYAKEYCHAEEFRACCRRENLASRGMILHWGFTFTFSEILTDPRDGSEYILDHYSCHL